MAQTTHDTQLRYLDAHDLDDSVTDFDRLEVRGTDDARLGALEGFLVEPASGRVLYTVVDSGGWFRSRRFLLPIGHARVDRDARALRVDVTRDTLRNYPEFDETRFAELSDADLAAYEARMAAVCCPDDRREPLTPAFETGRHYAQPAWWQAGAYQAERLQPVEPRPLRSRPAEPVAGVPAGDGLRGEHVTARADGPREDVSPHFGGRAQPGDVLGLETGGERTGVGDTAEDEDERRRDAERGR